MMPDCALCKASHSRCEAVLVAKTRANCSGIRCTSKEPEQVEAAGANGALGYAVEAFTYSVLDGN